MTTDDSRALQRPVPQRRLVVMPLVSWGKLRAAMVPGFSEGIEGLRGDEGSHWRSVSLPRIMPPSRRFSICWLLLVLAASLSLPLTAADGCDEPCGTHCGDCAWCPLTAELQDGDDAVRMIGDDLPARADRGSRPAFSRALDHVPILS
jgi:hypothetical protein